MRIFLAGASGVIGRRLVPLLVGAGHEVAGTTRSPERAERVRELGARPVVVDVYDAEALRAAVVDFSPELVMHQLTDLPDDVAELPARRADNARIREEGTANLIAAARAAGAERLLAQSIAWTPAAGSASRESLESQVLAFDGVGVVLRYGQFYGPGTFYEAEPPDPPRIQIDAAACRTAQLLEAPSGVIEILDEP
ncbi:MAG TPA: NAD-dependent epimerase/dehydratase family protein [Solirubrobacterales bacterium]|nr:NAD-dependent epimerase/dehydratase family protein [Solirubrobacterales bacterium]